MLGRPVTTDSEAQHEDGHHKAEQKGTALPTLDLLVVQHRGQCQQRGEHEHALAPRHHVPREAAAHEQGVTGLELLLDAGEAVLLEGGENPPHAAPGESVTLHLSSLSPGETKMIVLELEALQDVAVAFLFAPCARGDRPLAIRQIAQEIPPLLIGERSNPNGSKKFRECLLADDFDGCLRIGLDQ